MVSANDVADAFLARLASGRRVETVKLHKLLYVAQGLHLGLFGKPLFVEDIEAWVTGPVAPDVYQYHREEAFVRDGDYLGGNRGSLDDLENGLVDYVTVHYGNRPFSDIREWSMRKGMPWSRTAEREGNGGTISHEDIEEFFAREVVRIKDGGRPLPM